MKQPSVPWQRSLAHSTYPFCKKHNLVTRVLWVAYLQKHLLSPTLCVLQSITVNNLHMYTSILMRSGFEEEIFREAPKGFPRLPLETADFAKFVVGRETQMGWHPPHPRAETPLLLQNLSLAHRWQRIIASPPPIYFLTLTPMFPEFHNKPLRWYLFPDP